MERHVGTRTKKVDEKGNYGFMFSAIDSIYIHIGRK
jgi:hypothetical protein